MEILLWQAAVAGTVWLASRFHKQGHLLASAAWSIFTLVAVYAVPLIALQLVVAWGTAAWIHSRRSGRKILGASRAMVHAERENRSTVASEFGKSLPKGTVLSPASTTPDNPQGDAASRQREEEDSDSASSVAKRARPELSQAPFGASTCFPTFREASAYAKRSPGATIVRKGASFEVRMPSTKEKFQRAQQEGPAVPFEETQEPAPPRKAVGTVTGAKLGRDSRARRETAARPPPLAGRRVDQCPHGRTVSTCDLCWMNRVGGSLR